MQICQSHFEDFLIMSGAPSLLVNFLINVVSIYLSMGLVVQCYQIFLFWHENTKWKNTKRNVKNSE